MFMFITAIPKFLVPIRGICFYPSKFYLPGKDTATPMIATINLAFSENLGKEAKERVFFYFTIML